MGKDVAREAGTKAKVLNAAINIFGNQGFAGGSVRQIAEEAGTNIGAIKYHFGSKRGLWQEAVTSLFEELGAFILQDAHLWDTMSPLERVANSTRSYIRFCARFPELNRMLISEAIESGDRMQWLAENHVKLFIENSKHWMDFYQSEGIFPKQIPALNLVFISMSVSQYLFLMAPYIQHAFNINVFNEDEIDKHIDAVVAILFREETGKPIPS